MLDYSKTSLVAQWIRDEIRQVAPKIYLGQVYWEKKRADRLRAAVLADGNYTIDRAASSRRQSSCWRWPPWPSPRWRGCATTSRRRATCSTRRCARRLAPPRSFPAADEDYFHDMDDGHGADAPPKCAAATRGSSGPAATTGSGTR